MRVLPKVGNESTPCVGFGGKSDSTPSFSSKNGTRVAGTYRGGRIAPFRAGREEGLRCTSARLAYGIRKPAYETSGSARSRGALTEALRREHAGMCNCHREPQDEGVAANQGAQGGGPRWYGMTLSGFVALLMCPGSITEVDRISIAISYLGTMQPQKCMRLKWMESFIAPYRGEGSIRGRFRLRLLPPGSGETGQLTGSSWKWSSVSMSLWSSLVN